MSVFESSIARLMLAVVTAGVGFATMKNQSEFWFGSFVAITALWLILAIAALLDRRRTDRQAWAAFLLATLIALALGFGPWSDASFRGQPPFASQAEAAYLAKSTPTTKPLAAYLAKALPTTKAFLALQQYVKSYHCAEFRGYDQSGRIVSHMTVAFRPDCAFDLEQFVMSIEPTLRSDTEFFASFRNNYASQYTVAAFTQGVYLDACYLLASLLLGGIVGGVVRLVRYRSRKASIHPSGLVGALRPISLT
jgi:hypothetical protein